MENLSQQQVSSLVATYLDLLNDGCAGYSGVVVWDLSTNNPVTVPQVPYNPRQTKYVFTASSWLRFEVDNRFVLLLGSLRGDILVWDWDTQNQVT